MNSKTQAPSQSGAGGETPLDNTIRDYLNQAPTSEFRDQGVEIAGHWSGRDNLLWKVRQGSIEAVLKLYLDAGQARSHRQFDGQDLFSRQGLAPRPLWYDRYPAGLSRQILVYEWFPGRPLEASDAATLLDLAVAVGRIHSADIADVRRFCPHPINLEYLWSLLQGSIVRLGGWLEALPVPGLSALFTGLAAQAANIVTGSLPLWSGATPAAVHGDLSLDNSLTGAAGLQLVDWEMFGLGDPALEVATFLHRHQQEIGAELALSWLSSYINYMGQPGLPDRIQTYLTILPFRAVCYLLNGLHEMTLTDAKESPETVGFLSATLIATLDAAAAQLDVDAATVEMSVTELFQRLEPKLV